MNPLNRKMFRQPGMSRQPMGILASSPELANVVRRRTGQPVQMAHGGFHAPGDPMSSADANERAFRAGATRGLIPDALSALAAQGSGISNRLKSVLSKYPKSGFARPLLQRAMSMSAADQNALADQIEASEIETISRGKDPSMAQGIGTLREVGDVLTSDITPPSDLRRKLNPNLRVDIGIGDQGGVRPPIGTEVPDFEVPRGTLPDDVPTMPSEDIADQVTLPKRTPLDDDVDDDGPLLPKPNPDRGPLSRTDIGAAGLGVEPSKEKQPAEQAAENLMGTDQDAQFMQDPMSVVDMVRNAQDSPENKTAKQKADATDSILNIKNLKERKALLKNLLGEEKAKDIRTDAGYNLMMTGLLIAAGQSEDAMTNIAKGLAGGLQGYGTAVGEEAQAERKLDRELSMLAYSELSDEQKAARAAQVAEDARIADRAYRSTEAEKARNFEATQNALSRLSKEQIAAIGVENQFKIAELGVDSRERIAELNRDNQMAIAQLPSKEIQGLLDIFGDKKSVEAYLRLKASGTTGPQAKSAARAAQDIEELITKDSARVRSIRRELRGELGKAPTELQIQERIRQIAAQTLAAAAGDDTTDNTTDSEVTVIPE